GGLSGALVESDLIAIALDTGFTKPYEDSTIFDNKYGALVTYVTPMTYCENEFLFDQSITLKLHDQPQYFNAELINMLRISRYSDNFKIDPIIDEKEIPDLTNQRSVNEVSNGQLSSNSSSL
ncbi:unnamed protein product, partial [Rotaria sp. Silwood1]